MFLAGERTLLLMARARNARTASTAGLSSILKVDNLTALARRFEDAIRVSHRLN
jgi:hypothetical protein